MRRYVCTDNLLVPGEQAFGLRAIRGPRRGMPSIGGLRSRRAVRATRGTQTHAPPTPLKTRCAAPARCRNWPDFGRSLPPRSDIVVHTRRSQFAPSPPLGLAAGAHRSWRGPEGPSTLGPPGRCAQVTSCGHASLKSGSETPDYSGFSQESLRFVVSSNDRQSSARLAGTLIDPG